LSWGHHPIWLGTQGNLKWHAMHVVSWLSKGASWCDDDKGRCGGWLLTTTTWLSDTKAFFSHTSLMSWGWANFLSSVPIVASYFMLHVGRSHDILYTPFLPYVHLLEGFTKYRYMYATYVQKLFWHNIIKQKCRLKSALKRLVCWACKMGKMACGKQQAQLTIINWW
jgi:hypothetical protein